VTNFLELSDINSSRSCDKRERGEREGGRTWGEEQSGERGGKCIRPGACVLVLSKLDLTSMALRDGISFSLLVLRVIE